MRYEPYEVYEELFPSRRVFIAFSPSNYANEQWFTWQISVCIDFGLWQTSTLYMSRLGTSSGYADLVAEVALGDQRMVIAQVQVHSSIRSTPY